MRAGPTQERQTEPTINNRRYVRDHPETKAQSQRLVETLRAAGVPATAYPAAGKDHITINEDLGLPNDPPTEAVFTFLAAVLKTQ